MELEFDKEIDAILRRARAAEPVSASGAHADADTIAAFVENALPPGTRTLYTRHFADCGRCRKLLSQAISMNETADAAAADVVVPVPVKAAIPWYSRLFRAPSLAVAMGALIVMFGGILTYMVIRDRQRGVETVSQVTDANIAAAPYSSSPAEAPAGTTANSAAPITSGSTAANITSNTTVAAGTANSATNTAAAPAKPADTATASKVETLPLAGRSVDDLRLQPGVAAAPPPPTAGTVTTGDRQKTEKKAEEVRKEEPELAKSKDEDTIRAKRDAPPAAAKSGPARSGPVQMQSNQINNMGEMAVTRKVGGKTFENKNRAWYDREYSGQATQNFTRGTDEYKGLDKGLRSIADTLGGTVVMVWKGKAYRIR